MRKKILIGSTISLIALVLAFLLSPSPPPILNGALPCDDVAEITRVVRKSRRASLAPRFSWDSIKELPSALRSHSARRIVSISASTNAATVIVGEGHGPLARPCCAYMLKKGPAGWEISGYDEVR